jgi:hypothetical protein
MLRTQFLLSTKRTRRKCREAALPELDPGLGGTKAYAVDREEHNPLSSEHGPWRIIVVGDGRASRWVRQLMRIEVVQVQ